MKRNQFFYSALVFFGFASCSGLQKEEVDLIIHNAVIYTINDAFDIVEAIAIRSDTIVALGAEHQILNKYQSKETIDARKQFVYPGFIDGHCHFYGYALGLTRVNLVGLKSWEACIEKIQAFAGENPNLEWIVGRGWDQNLWEHKHFPNKHLLDSLFPDKAVYLQRIDGHAAIANQKALELAKITKNTKVDGGSVLLENDELSGILIDNAVDLVKNIVPELPIETQTKALKQAEKNLFEKGITSVVDAGLSLKKVAHLEKLIQKGDLQIRIDAMLEPSDENFDFYLSRGPQWDERLFIHSFKFYADGALGSRGALLLNEYTDDPGNKGLLLFNPKQFEEQLTLVYNNGFQANTHCIGDSANRLVLDSYGKILGSVNDRRWRIEHAQVVHPDDVRKFADFTVIPSVQPTHATSDMPWAQERLGERIQYAYTFKELLKQNSLIAIGSDFPVEDIDPLLSFTSGVFRKNSLGEPKEGFQLENALSPVEVLKGLTIWNAIAMFQEERLGSLAVGKQADLVLLNADVLKARFEDFANIKIQQTYVAGKRVY